MWGELLYGLYHKLILIRQLLTNPKSHWTVVCRSMGLFEAVHTYKLDEDQT